MLLQREIYFSFIVRVCFQSICIESFRLDVITRQVAKGLLRRLGGAGRNLRHSHVVTAYGYIKTYRKTHRFRSFFFFFFFPK